MLFLILLIFKVIIQKQKNQTLQSKIASNYLKVEMVTHH